MRLNKSQLKEIDELGYVILPSTTRNVENKKKYIYLNKIFYGVIILI